MVIACVISIEGTSMQWVMWYAHHVVDHKILLMGEIISVPTMVNCSEYSPPLIHGGPAVIA